MGGVPSHNKTGFLELRDSIPGSLVPEQDFGLFYSKCKIETARTMSSVLRPSPSQLFFIVISGEVNVQLSSPDVKNKVISAATFTAGEMIHFFNSSTSCNNSSTLNDSSECMRYGDVKLSLHFNQKHRNNGRVIGIDQQAYNDFVVHANGNLHTLTSFLGLNIVNSVKKSPIFKNITSEQTQVFCMLLKVQFAFAGKIIDIAGPTPRSKRDADAPDPVGSTPSPKGCSVMYIHGTGLSVPLNTNLASLANRIVRAEVKANSSSITGSPKKINRSVGFAFRAPAKLPDVPGLPGIFELPDIHKPIPLVERDNSLRGKNLVAVQAGTNMGLDTYFSRSPGVRAYMATAASVLGYIAHTSMDALMEADQRFMRVLRRNFMLVLLNWVKFSVNFIMDMDEWSLALLSCKVTLRGCAAGEAVKRKGDSSEYAYIVLGGSCKELANPIEDGSPEAGADRTIGWGGLIGEVALTTNTPYFHTVVAEEPTLLMVVGKRVLDQIYYNNKAKLCEIRIRMMGTDVDLLHAIDHPRGSKLFKEYLTRLHAQENLAFYMEIDKYDTMCISIAKLYSQVLQMRARALQAEKHDTKLISDDTNAANSLFAADTLIAEESADQADCDAVQQTDQNASTHSLLNYSEVNSNNNSGHNLGGNDDQHNPDGIASAGTEKRKMQSSKNIALFASHRITIVEDSGHSNADDVKTSLRCTLSAGTATALVSDPVVTNAASTVDCMGGAFATTSSGANVDVLPPRSEDSGAAPVDAIVSGISPPNSQRSYRRSSFLQSKADTVESALCQDKSSQPVISDEQAGVRADSEGELTPQNDSSRRPSVETKQDLQLRIRRNVHKIQKSIVELKEVAKLIMETYVLEGSSQQLNLPGLMRLRAEKTFNLWYHSSSAKVKLPARQDSFQLMDTAQFDSIDITDPSGQNKGQVSSDSADSTVGLEGNKATPFHKPLVSVSNSIRMLRRDFTSDSNEDSVLQHSVLLPAPINTALPYLPKAARKYASTSEAESPSAYLTLSGDSGNYAHQSVEGIDMSFVDLFKEAKQEILKLLRDDKFPRWKETTEFQAFIANVRPYERDKYGAYALNTGVNGHSSSSDKSRSMDSRSYRS